MSGYAADDIASRLAHLDAAGYLQKPIMVKDLLNKVALCSWASYRVGHAGKILDSSGGGSRTRITPC